MTQRAQFLVNSLVKAIALFSLLGVFLSPTVAQQSMEKPVSVDDKSSKDGRPRPFAAIEEEMRAKRAIKFAEKEYQENLERARDLSTLSEHIVASFKQNRALDREDFKKLDKVEKLAKGIRHAAGGSEDKVEMERPPRDLADAMRLLEELSKSLKDKVEKTPKHVISASVIDESNVLLELIRIVRTLPPRV